MSHVASVKCFVQDLDGLERVAKDLGFELVRDAKTYAWFGRWVNDFRGAQAAVDNGHRPEDFGKCVHKLRRVDHRDGMYEIGVVNRVDGKPGFELVYDNWSSGGAAIEAKAGKGLVTLKNAIAEDVTSLALKRKGYRVVRTVDAKTGAIKLTGMKG
jgi:hypothetical protein